MLIWIFQYFVIKSFKFAGSIQNPIRMKKPFFLLFLLVCLVVTILSCSNIRKKSRKPISTIILKPNKENYTIGEPLSIEVKTKLFDGKIAKIELYYGNNLITTNNKPDFEYTYNKISSLGPKTIKVVAILTDSVSNTRYKNFSVLSDMIPEMYNFEVVKEYPHSTAHFTEGLEMHDGFLYESTGQNGSSAIHKIVLKTGKTIQKKSLPKQYFGEGITILNNKIYQLTYTSKKGFVYNFSDFALVDSFHINSDQGWGMTNDGKYLIMSDGTNKLTWIDPKNYSTVKTLFVASNTQLQDNLNELEYVNGYIFANIWQQDYIVEIDPETGKIIATTDLSGLYNLFTPDERTNVLNGIAYDKSSGDLLVTGKLWPVLFEIKLKKSE